MSLTCSATRVAPLPLPVAATVYVTGCCLRPRMCAAPARCRCGLYLARAGYTSGPLFRPSIKGSGGRLSYDAAHARWVRYCTVAGAGIAIHQLRHAHGTELINSGVSIEAVRRRLSTLEVALVDRAAPYAGYHGPG